MVRLSKKGEFKLEELLNKIGVIPNNIKLYYQAFTHSSYSFEHIHTESYERLEFLGDAIVDLVVSDYLYNSKLYKEGEMTKIRASYVCENALYEYGMDLGFSNYIKVGHGEIVTGGKYKKAIVADVFEALMGAIYLDLGYSKVKEVALNIIVPYIEDKSKVFFSDYKSALQEAVQTDKKSMEYVLLEESGPSHHKYFKVEVKVDDIVYGVGEGGSKKEAEQNAAKKALELLANK